MKLRASKSRKSEFVKFCNRYPQISQNYTFRCHRKEGPPNAKDQTFVYAVNDINFHPVQGTFSTAGSDGMIHYWDRDARSRLKSTSLFSWWFTLTHHLFMLNIVGFEACPGPIPVTTFNRTGDIFAYAVSYDWSNGYTGMTAGHPNKVMLHACKAEEVKKREIKK